MVDLIAGKFRAVVVAELTQVYLSIHFIIIYSKCNLHRYGQLSGMVEPIAGVFGAVAVVIAEPLLPYALAFAAGAMVYVVVDDIIPESQTA